MPDILNTRKIEEFIHQGFIRIDDAFSTEIAEAALDILWQDLPCDRSNPGNWTEPVIRLKIKRTCLINVNPLFGCF